MQKLRIVERSAPKVRARWRPADVDHAHGRGATGAGWPVSVGEDALARLDTPLLRPAEAAELLAVKPSWVYDAFRAGTLGRLRIG